MLPPGAEGTFEGGTRPIPTSSVALVSTPDLASEQDVASSEPRAKLAKKKKKLEPLIRLWMVGTGSHVLAYLALFAWR